MTERQRELDLSARSKSLRALLIKESMSSAPATAPPPAPTPDEPGQTISQRAGRRKSGKNTYVELTDGEFFDEVDNLHERDSQTAEEVMEMAREANDKSSRSRINNQRLDSMISELRLLPCNHSVLDGFLVAQCPSASSPTTPTSPTRRPWPTSGAKSGRRTSLLCRER